MPGKLVAFRVGAARSKPCSLEPHPARLNEDIQLTGMPFPRCDAAVGQMLMMSQAKPGELAETFCGVAAQIGRRRSIGDALLLLIFQRSWKSRSFHSLDISRVTESQINDCVWATFGLY
jgi:hypothetical protein